MTGSLSVCFLNESKESTPSEVFKYQVSIYCWSDDHRCNTVRTFVNVFLKIFNTPNTGGHLDVNMCIKHNGKVRVVGHHPSIVLCKAIWSLSKHSTTVLPTVERVTIFMLCCFLKKSSQITFLAYTINHAGCAGVFLAAQSVQQTFCDCFKKRCILCERKLCQHQAIYVFVCGNFLL
jgi:hypothetical protein